MKLVCVTKGLWQTNKLNSEQIKEIIDHYVIKKYNLADIQRKLGYAPVTSKKYLIENGIEIKSAAYQSNINVKKNRDKYRLYNVNKDFFDTWSSDMAYICGFLITDGSISGNRIKLALQIQDKYILENMAKTVGYTGNVLDGIAKCKGKEYPYSQLDITCYEWLDSLRKIEIYPNNTFTANFPDIPSEFIHDFIRGVFDGDGSTKQGRYLRTGFYNGSYNLIEGLNNRLVELGLSDRNIYKTKTNCYCIEYAQKDSLKLYNVMYKGESMHLHRKKVIFEKYM